MFSESHLGLLFMYACAVCKRREDIVHHGTSHAGEDNDPEEDEEDIIPAQGVQAGLWVEIGDLEELPGMMLGSRNAQVNEGEKGEQVERNGCFQRLGKAFKKSLEESGGSPIWWSTIQVQASSTLLFSLPLLLHLGIAVFWDGEALCDRCSCVHGLCLSFSRSIVYRPRLDRSFNVPSEKTGSRGVAIRAPAGKGGAGVVVDKGRDVSEHQGSCTLMHQ